MCTLVLKKTSNDSLIFGHCYTTWVSCTPYEIRELLFGVTQMKNKLGFDYIKIYSTQILARPFCDRLNAMCFSTINLFCNIAVCIPTVPPLQNCIEMLSFSAANSTAGKSKVMRPIKQWVRLKLNQIFTICKQEVTQVLELLDKSTAQQPLIGPIIHGASSSSANAATSCAHRMLSETAYARTYQVSRLALEKKKLVAVSPEARNKTAQNNKCNAGEGWNGWTPTVIYL